MSSPLEIKPASKAFIEVAKIWHTDEKLNQAVGFGKGQAGVTLAQAALDKLSKGATDWDVWSAWLDGEPVGYLVVTDKDTYNKTADVHVTIPEVHQNQGLGPLLLETLVEKYFSEREFFRLTFRPMTWNKRAIAVGKKAGFKLEAYTTFSAWTPAGPASQAQMRITKPEWLRRSSGSKEPQRLRKS